MLALRKPVDPETDQEASITVYVLRIRAEGVASEEWRSNWMDGSDADDDDQHSGNYASCKRIDGKLRAISTVPLI
ncbi:MAG: hypothetical protein AOA66_0968 [Candidatus Bathyarchaeota archaeon BA2]|nr:MAG: hypothetical protein AOA66_0968 [Candidatus Bathyarchaeota archaeon BA2]